jgi:branched-chain amino acid transport system ATP-binding protein
MFEIANVSAGYGDTIVLRDVSIVVPESSVVAVLGSNGAGKTTLLRVASGLLRPRSGTVALDGQDFTRRRPYQRSEAGICHVPEGRGIFWSLTVRENLLLHVQKRHEEAIARAVEVFPILGTRLGQMAGTLSGGEQQMLSLARAYVSNPRVVLLDEVSMGLAPLIVDEIFAFLARFGEGGTSLLLVEQYVTRALEIADYVYVMSRGQLTFAGEPSELDQEEVFERYLGVAG